MEVKLANQWSVPSTAARTPGATIRAPPLRLRGGLEAARRFSWWPGQMGAGFENDPSFSNEASSAHGMKPARAAGRSIAPGPARRVARCNADRADHPE